MKKNTTLGDRTSPAVSNFSITDFDVVNGIAVKVSENA